MTENWLRPSESVGFFLPSLSWKPINCLQNPRFCETHTLENSGLHHSLSSLCQTKHFGGIIWRCWGPWAEVSGTGGHAHSLLHPTDQTFSPVTVCLCVSGSCSFSQLAYDGLGKTQIIHRWKNLEITAHLKSWQF